jgi:hypothetical protein
MRRPAVAFCLLAGASALAGGLALAPWPARAQANLAEPSPETAEGYCEFVKGVAASQSVLLWSPELFGNFGYIDQQTGVIEAPERTGAEALRLTAGLRYRLSGAFEGIVLRDRADADCRRQRALSSLQQTVRSSEHAAARAGLSARLRVVEGALPEARTLLQGARSGFEQRDLAAPELTAVRLRVDELQAMAAATKRELDQLPPPPSGPPQAVPAALRAYYAADAEVEQNEASLRGVRSWDVSLRLGYDRFLQGDDSRPLFGVLSVGYNLGGLWQGGANRRAMSGRRQYVAQEGRRAQEQLGLDQQRLQATAVVNRHRQTQTAALLADLEEQLRGVTNIQSSVATRYRQTLWFDWVKIKAEDEYLRAYLKVMAGLSAAPVGS